MQAALAGRRSRSQLARQRRALFELLGIDDFATRSTFQSHDLEHRNDQFDRGTREFIERTLDGVIRALG